MDRLRAMELFLSVSQTGSFSETARSFGVSATAVSRAITEFEQGLQIKLLLRCFNKSRPEQQVFWGIAGERELGSNYEFGTLFKGILSGFVNQLRVASQIP